MTTNSTASALGTASLRILAGVVGGGIIAGVTYAAVTAIGGIHAPTAPLLIAHAVGLVVGAMCIGLAFRSRRFVVAAGLILTLVAGEAYTLLNTSERELEAREAKQVPARDAMERRKSLSVAIAKGEAALAAMTMTTRLEKALEAQRSISKMSAETSAQQGCGRYCTETLKDGRAGAQRDVDAARAALDADRKVIETAIQSDRAALAAIPVVAALSPLAARTSVADWKLDLIRAGLLTLSANGLGAFLLVFAAHSGRREENAVDAVRDTVRPETVKALSFENEKGDRPDKEIEEIKEILSRIETACNSELAKLAGVDPSEMSKRWRKAEKAGIITAERSGRHVHLRLVA